MLDLSGVCDLHHSSWQQWILNPLSKAKDQTQNLILPSQICFRCTTTGTPEFFFLNILRQRLSITETRLLRNEKF